MFRESWNCWLILLGVFCLGASPALAGDNRRVCYVGFENQILWIQDYFGPERYPAVEQSIRSGIASRCQANRYLRWWNFVAADPQRNDQFPQMRLILDSEAGWRLRIELYDKRGNRKDSYLFDPESPHAESLDLTRPVPDAGNEIDEMIGGAPPLEDLDTDLPDWFATAFLGQDCRHGQEVLEKVCQGLPIGDVIVLADPNELQGRLLMNFADFGELTTSWFWVYCQRNAADGGPGAAARLTSVGHHDCRIVERNGHQFQSVVLRHTRLDGTPIVPRDLPRLQQLRPVECVMVKPVYMTQYAEVPCRR
jgi:hypothetical protein